MNLVAATLALKQLLLAAMFAAWKATTMEEKCVSAQAENSHMQKMLGKQATSIWSMGKDQLVEVAVKEVPGLTREQARAMRKGEIQLMVKKCRDAVAIEPMLPKGLTRMKHQELMEEADKRGISTTDPTKRSAVKVREQLIADIKEYEIAKAHTDAMAELNNQAADSGGDFVMEDSSATSAAPLVSAAPSQGASAASSLVPAQPVPAQGWLNLSPEAKKELMNLSPEAKELLSQGWLYRR